MRYARVGWLVAVPAALLLAGCAVTGTSKQTPPPEPLTHAQFVRAANRACGRAFRRTPHFTPGESITAYDSKLEALIRVQERLLFELRGLRPPPRDAHSVQRLLATFNYLDLTINHFLDTVNRLDLPRIRKLGKRVNFLAKRLDTRARRLGLVTCASR